MYPTQQDNIVAYAKGPIGPSGPITQADIDALLDGVAADGDTLAKLRALIALRAPLDGANMTNATTPTAANGADSTALASTAFVQQELTNFGVGQQTLLDGKIGTGSIDTDSTMAANSDSKIPSQKATKTAIAAAVAALVNSSPSALDTLKELADALGDDANFAATMVAALAGKLSTAAFPRGLLNGLTLSTVGSSATFGVASGVAADSASAQVMSLASAYTKTTSAWAVGTANGSLDTGSIANSTWYHVHLIKRTDTGVVDILISLSATAPTLPTNYTLSRRIGSMLTNGSAQWVKFIQDGDTFTWDVPVGDVTASDPGTSAILRSLTVPVGVNIKAIIHARSSTTTAASAVGTIFTDPAQTDTTPTFTNAQQIGNTALSPFSNLVIRTNTSRQIRVRLSFSDANVSFTLVTDGWIDARGRV